MAHWFCQGGKPGFCFFFNDSVWRVLWMKCWPKLRSKKRELIMKWVSQGDGFSSGIELKKIKLFFKRKRQHFFIFKTLLFILTKSKLFTKNAQMLKYIYMCVKNPLLRYSLNILECMFALISIYTPTFKNEKQCMNNKNIYTHIIILFATSSCLPNITNHEHLSMSLNIAPQCHQ